MTEPTAEMVVYEDGAALPAMHQPPPVMGTASLTGALALLPQYLELAQAIFKTDMVPTSIRHRADAVLAVMMAGYEIGIPPFQALSSIDIIEGKPSLSPELMRALIMAQGHLFIVKATRTEATVVCRRKDWPKDIPNAEHTWTIEEASQIVVKGKKLTDKDNWKNYPKAMLSARVTGEAGRANFADVLKGLSYTPDEVEDWEPQLAGLGSGTKAEDEVSPPASTETAAELMMRLATIKAQGKEVQDALKAQWMERNVPPFNVRTLTEAEASTIDALLSEFEKAQPEPQVETPPTPPSEVPPEPTSPKGVSRTAIETLVTDLGWGPGEFAAVARYALGRPSFDGNTGDLLAKDFQPVYDAIQKAIDGALVLVANEGGFDVVEYDGD